jgi:hypothetical protein
MIYNKGVFYMKDKMTNKEKELLKKYYSCGISIEALSIASGYDISLIKKVLGIKK